MGKSLTNSPIFVPAKAAAVKGNRGESANHREMGAVGSPGTELEFAL